MGVEKRLRINIWEINCRSVQSRFDAGLRLADMNPNGQHPDWMKYGIELLERGEELTPEKLKKSQEFGGKDHPDPTLHSMG